ncbi:MAG: hypothetical protein E4H05_07010 [Acidimicrobiales bacterium]|nr:MAG: hypothetical protein E4H05_07010 [Acidimicrobiales bacterium]
MRSAIWLRLVGAAALTLGATGCGSDGSEATVPTAAELASSLVATDDFEGEWTVNEPPDDSAESVSGVITDDQRDMLPTFELCDQASPDSRAAAGELRWTAFRQLDSAVEDPIKPPNDRTGHMVFVQEFLTSGEPDEIETTFGLLRDGMQACLGDIPAGEEGPGTAEAMTLPDVGDDREGMLITIEEAGGGAEWRLHNALVRQGAVLMLMDVVDIRAGEGVEPYYSVEDVGQFVEIAIDRL